MSTPQPFLSVRDLKTRFNTPEGTIYAVNGVSFDVAEGETLAVVGESGCGKSVTMMSILRLIPIPPGEITSGQAQFQGRDLLKLSEEQMEHVRGKEIAMVFQDPMTSLNPVLSVGRQLTETLHTHTSLDAGQARARAAELLTWVGIPEAENRLGDFPHQFSGGMRQRVMIAMALACSPGLLIADEPTTALDVTIQAQIVELVKRLRDELGMAVIWITHDLGIVAGLAQRVIVMYGGYIIEDSPVKDLYANPQHPYTIGLLGSLPRIDGDKHGKLYSIEGIPPTLMQKPTNCPFAPRCQWAMERCYKENPILEEVAPDHRVACWVEPKTGRSRK